MERSVLFEMLVLEAKGYLNIPPSRVIELCSGWGEDSCDEEMEYRKYLEAYDRFLFIHADYVMDNLHDFGIIVMLENVGEFISQGHSYYKAVVMMIQDKFSCLKVRLAQPPIELMKPEYQEGVKLNPNYLDVFMFDGKIEQDTIRLEIID